MASTFSDLLRLEKQANGENDSTWGTRVNTVFEMIEDAIANFTSVVMAADANRNLTTANSATDEARCMGLLVTSGVSLTATRDIICPTSTKSYLVKNSTTGAQSIRVKTAAGTGITIPNGKTAMVLCDGTNVISAIDWVNALSLGTPLAIADGGTASTTASVARTALGLVISTDVQPFDADLTALAGLGSTGFGVRTAANTWAQRSLANATAGITWTNADGTAGNPTPVLANDLAALEGLGSTGIGVRTAADTWAQRSIAGTANQITATNGDGVAGNPTLSLPSAITLPGSLTMGGLFDLGATGQIKFPATQNVSGDANTLDDYEEGTFSATPGGTSTSSQTVGNYTKIGRVVIINGRHVVNAIGTGSTTVLRTLPFPARSDSIVAQPISVSSTSGLATAVVSIGAHVQDGNDGIAFTTRTAASTGESGSAVFANGTSVHYGGTYLASGS